MADVASQPIPVVPGQLLPGTLTPSTATATTTTPSNAAASRSSLPNTYTHTQTTRSSILGYQRLPNAHPSPPPRHPLALVPSVGDIVIGRVTAITPRHAHVDVTIVNGRPVREKWHSLVRLHDVRDEDRASVKMELCFRPGDIVQAKVLSLGDERYFYLSTVAVDHGVVYARGRKSGAVMVPVGWEVMECPETGEREGRKVAMVVAKMEVDSGRGMGECGGETWSEGE